MAVFRNNTALAFMLEYGLTHINLDILKDVLKRQGFVVVKYNRSGPNDIDVETLLNALKLKEHAARTHAFTYCDNENRVVFVNENLSEYEQLVLLSHEEGHIYNGHFDQVYKGAGRDVLDEKQANDFSYCLLNLGFVHKALLFACTHRTKLAVYFLTTVLAVSSIFVAFAPDKEADKTSSFWVTATGKKYHDEDCTFVQGKANVRKVSLDEIQEGGYGPCKVCNPNE